MAVVGLLWARVTITEEENMQVQEDLPQQFGVDLKGRQLTHKETFSTFLDIFWSDFRPSLDEPGRFGAK